MKIRLYTPMPFAEKSTAVLSEEQVHYLVAVLRVREGDSVFLFNGQDGEWRSQVEKITAPSKKNRAEIVLRLDAPSAPHLPPAPVTLAFARLKKNPTEFLIQKAVELGAGVLQPLITEYTQPHNAREDRWETIILEAAEQCGLTAIPQVSETATLENFLKNWNPLHPLLFCDEQSVREKRGDTLEALQASPPTDGERWGILIGPEGGFSPAEVKLLRSLSFTVPISLGLRIMRAETAAVAALTLWQCVWGDWRQKN